MENNLILIGMPAAGKSVVGRRLAADLGCAFVDTDDLIMRREGMSLRRIIERDGLSDFRALEEAVILELEAERTVIATGGSVVYSAPAMAHLGRLGPRIFLDVPLPELAARVGDLAARGLVIAPGQSFAELYQERLPLYRRYADWTLAAAGQSVPALAGQIARRYADAGASR